VIVIIIVAVAGLVAGLTLGAVFTRWRDRVDVRIASGLELSPGSPRSLASMAERMKKLLDESSAESLDRARLLELFEVGLDTSRSGIVVGAPDGTIAFRNAVARSFSEARHSEALVASTVTEVLVEAREGSTDRLIELLGPPPRSFHVVAHPLVRDEELLGTVAFIADVSESRRVEAVRRDFVTNVSHELKTPIGAITLLAETISVDDEPAVLARLIGRLQSEAHRVADTIDDLMTLSSIEARDGSRFELLDMRQVADSAMDRLREAADLKHIELRPPAPGAPLEVLGERIQLESAVFNLVDNAVKYCEHGDRIEVRLAQGAGLVAVAVQDDGVGIPASELERIFERFYRVDKARSRDTGGTGLGLAIVRHVVRNHGGEIEVASREGEGSTFTILLPHAGDQTEAELDSSVAAGEAGESDSTVTR
jgi:two-component system sensor histidine kinase SenX3